jgi:CRISPR-associated endoribonuclease Cas6
VLCHKLEAAGFTGEHLDTTVQFDQTYRGARTKLVTIKGISHKASLCPVVVTGTPDAVRFAWEVGIGELTGSGCGAVR